MKSSEIITAFQALANEIQVTDPQKEGQFGLHVTVRTGNVVLTNAELDMEFSIPFDDDVQANEAEIVVYNLSKTTRTSLHYDAVITVSAGYADDTGVVFAGRISKVTTKHDGTDLKTTICAIDDRSLQEREITNVAFAANVSASYILKSLLEKVGLPIAVFNTRYDYTYADAVNIDGGLMENIKRYASVCGVSCFINRGKIYALNVTASPLDLQFTVSADTGMIGSPEEFTEEVEEDSYQETVKGYRVQMLLQHRMTCGAVCNLRALDVSGKFYVRSGSHTYNSTECITEVEMIARG